MQKEKGSQCVSLRKLKAERKVRFEVGVCADIMSVSISPLKISVNTSYSDSKLANMSFFSDTVMLPGFTAHNSQRRLSFSQKSVAVCVPECVKIEYNTIPLRHFGVCVFLYERASR